MNLVMVGCEYSGTTTLAWEFYKWTKETIGEGRGFHDHWKVPHLSHPGMDSAEALEEATQAWSEGKGPDPTTTGFSDKEQEDLLALTPYTLEMFQRYHMDYHVSTDFYSYHQHSMIGMHIDEAVYAGLYYGYGGDGEYADRKVMAPHIEQRMLAQAPDTVLILCQAPPDVIRSRMKENPKKHGIVKEKDVDLVIQRFEEEYERSLIKNKFTVDTGTKTPSESLADFVDKYEPYITDADRIKMLVHKAKKKGDWT